MKVSLAIPYRGTTSSRVAAYQRMLSQVVNLFPWDNVESYDSDPPEPFNRAAARNLAVRENANSDVVVICDADSIPEQRPLRNAIFSAKTVGQLNFPFDQVIYLTREGTRYINSRKIESLPVLRRAGSSQGGCFVCSPRVWWDFGGMDERLSGWGYEDRQMLICSNTLGGKPIIHEGKLYCLWHRKTPADVPKRDDSLVFMEYESLNGDSQRLREYIDKRGRYDL